MQTDTATEMARYIFTTGKLMHDKIIRIQDHYLSSSEAGGMGELSISQLHMIRMVREAGQLTIGELAEKLTVSPPSASAMVDRLVGKGALCREHSTQDRRKVVVRITPAAVKNVKEIETRIMQLFTDLVTKIGVETARKWCEVLDSVKKVLDDESDPAVSASDTSPGA